MATVSLVPQRSPRRCRREDGRRHDAAQTIQAFSTHLRDQLDLDTLGASCWRW